MLHIQIEKRNNDIVVAGVPFHPDFVEASRRLRGIRNHAGSWIFDARDEQAVRAALIETFGTDGSADDRPLATLHVRLHAGGKFGKDLFLAGRKSERVRLGDGCVILQGSFPASGGSMNYPDLEPVETIVIEVRDIPRVAADTETARRRDSSKIDVWIVEESSDPPTVRPASLTEQRLAAAVLKLWHDRRKDRNLTRCDMPYCRHCDQEGWKLEDIQHDDGCAVLLAQAVAGQVSRSAE